MSKTFVIFVALLTWPLNHYVLAASSKSCSLPDIQNGIYAYIVECAAEDENLPANQTLTNGQVRSSCEVTVKCNEGYSTRPESASFSSSLCHQAKWKPDLPQCKKMCAKLDTQGLNVNLRCYENSAGQEVGCDVALFHGSKVKLQCQQHYIPKHWIGYDELKCNANGEWDREPFPCVPACGNLIQILNPLIAIGVPEKFGNAPWHVAIYEKQKNNTLLTCSGTIISVRAILTAAHCFHNRSNLEIFNVVVAKFSRKYTTIDNHFQKSYKIKEIHVPDRYRGVENNFAADIALLILQNNIRLSNVVAPACLETPLTLFNVPSGLSGKVSGWGLDSSNTCVELHPLSNRASIELDKFCGGNITGPGIREGDFGGGFLIPHPNSGFYYVRGVASHIFAENSSVSVFTDVHDYVSWIREIITEIKTEVISTSTSSYETSEVPSLSNSTDRECGTTRHNVGEEKLAALGHWPWIASFNSSEKFCLGCLISDRWILTSALCGRDIKNNKIKFAHLGDLHLQDNADGAIPTDVPIDKVIQHYNYEFGLLGHNIALVRRYLIISNELTENIQPISLPTEEEFRNGSFYSNKHAVHVWYGGNKMYQEETTLHEPETCRKMLHTTSEIEQNEVCADTCKGGVATPIMMQIPSKSAFHVIGFWSYYIPGYSCSNTKTFFIKVARFSNWTKDTMNRFEEDTISSDTPQEFVETDGFIDAIETEKYARLGQYPWIASFDSPEKFCLGCLISERWILTSALCARDIKINKIKVAHLGDLHLKDDIDGADPIDVPIDKVVQHYNYEFGLLGHNIALIRLSSPVPVSENIHPIGVPSEKQKNSSLYAEKRAVHVWYSNNKMRQEVVKLHDAAVCHKMTRTSAEIEENEICADSCEGGVATPLIMRIPSTKEYHVLGFWSYYVRSDCPKRKTFFIKLAQFSKWINETMSNWSV